MPVALTQVELQHIERLREQELEEARIIQGVMLPAQPLRSEGILISHECQPVTEVGGDYLDYFHLSDGTIGLYVGDVSGKGLPAALYAALAVGTLRGIQKTGMMPSRVVSLLNQRLLLRGIPGRHTAIQYAVFDPATGEMRIVSAGMPGPLLLRGNTCSTLKVAGIPPGLFPQVEYDEYKIQLQAGDSLLFFTDGLTDARSVDDEEFEEARLHKTCLEHSSASPLELLEHIFCEIQKFSTDCRQYDDMTATLFQYSPGIIKKE
jgi:sigma-B regulation protein RsbU (phosphoserine phosphatase)